MYKLNLTSKWFCDDDGTIKQPELIIEAEVKQVKGNKRDIAKVNFQTDFDSKSHKMDVDGSEESKETQDRESGTNMAEVLD